MTAVDNIIIAIYHRLSMTSVARLNNILLAGPQLIAGAISTAIAPVRIVAPA